MICGSTRPTRASSRRHARKITGLYIPQYLKKHGIELIGFWTPTEGEEAKDTLIYIVAFPSVKAQKKAWDAFWADPEWKKVKAESEKDGVLVKEIEGQNLKATDYSPIR